MARKTKEEALATRELLLDTAERMFLQRGVARTSLNDIAQAAGLTRGAVYWHFEDKVALYLALMERLSTCLPRPLVDGEDPVAGVRELTVAPIRLLRQDERARRLITIAKHRVEFSEDLAAIWNRHVDKGSQYIALIETGLIQAEAAAGHPLRLRPRPAALGMFALVDGLVTYATLHHTDLQALDNAEGMVDTYLAGLGLALPGTRVGGGV